VGDYDEKLQNCSLALGSRTVRVIRITTTRKFHNQIAHTIMSIGIVHRIWSTLNLPLVADQGIFIR